MLPPFGCDPVTAPTPYGSQAHLSHLQERLDPRDPRRSMEERYPTKDSYVETQQTISFQLGYSCQTTRDFSSARAFSLSGRVEQRGRETDNVRVASTDLTAPKFDFRSSPERWGNRPAQLVDS